MLIPAASTQPGDGTIVHPHEGTDATQIHNSGQNYESVGQGTRKSSETNVPFKEKVIGPLLLRGTRSWCELSVCEYWHL